MAHALCGDAPLTAVELGLVLTSALLHAWWSVSIKGSRDPLTFNALQEVAPLVASLALLPLVFVIFDSRLIAATLAFLFTVITMALISGLFLAREIRDYPVGIESDHSSFKEIREYSWPVALSNITNQLKNRVDVFVIGYAVGAAEVGLFSVGLTMATVNVLPSDDSAAAMSRGAYSPLN